MKKYEALAKFVAAKKVQPQLKPSPKPAPGGKVDETKRLLARKPAAPKKDAFGASGGWEGMTGLSKSQKIAEMRKAGISESDIKDMLQSGKKK